MGRSYAAFLRGAPPRQWTNRLFFEYSYVRALRTQTLKYVERGEGWPSELFDLEADPAESTNVIDAPAYRTQREALRRELEARFKKLGAPPLDEWRSISRTDSPRRIARAGKIIAMKPRDFLNRPPFCRIENNVPAIRLSSLCF